jgi:Tfp pilus assembly protein PilV
MRNLMLAVLATGGILSGVSTLASNPAAAAPAYPYCIQSQAFGTDCSYPSYQACQATASGRGVECIANPSLAYSPQPVEPRRGRRAVVY